MNFFDALQPKYPDDIKLIRDARIPLLDRLSDIEIQVLWERFSDDYCAGWLNVSPTLLTQFKDWIRS